LLVAKARALVAEHVGVDPTSGPDLHATAFPGGAVVRVGDAAWVLLDDTGARGLGPALVLAQRENLHGLHLMVDSVDLAGVLARRSAEFRDGPTVWRVEGRSLVLAEPAGVPVPVEPPAVARELVGMLLEAGVDVTVEHGEIRGEIRGLEIARVVVVDDGARLEVGVGRHDREAFTMVHGHLPTDAALRSVIASVDAARRADAEAHPLRHLAPEGWLRWRVVAEPGLVGAAELRVVEPPVPRESVKDTSASIAVGTDDEGRPIVVVCSVGIDLDVVPTAADARVLHAPDARLVVVVPERDDHPVTRRLAESLVHPAEVIGLPGDWRDGRAAT
jgi:hypothetical protein